MKKLIYAISFLSILPSAMPFGFNLVPGTFYVGPAKQCRRQWHYVGQLDAFKNSQTHPGFNEKFNPSLTISKLGLTVRVVGVLDEKTIEKFGSLEKLTQAYPYVHPIKYDARFVVPNHDVKRGPWFRENHTSQKDKGIIVSTEIVKLPKNSVMVVYPISIAKRGHNTPGGNWKLKRKTRRMPNNRQGSFGAFPFMSYTIKGHALHGPITKNTRLKAWKVRRGKVSHGCSRMEGEHSTELSVLLGCEKTPMDNKWSGKCTKPNEKVTVLNNFDRIPKLDSKDLTEGNFSNFESMANDWVVVDVEGFERDKTSPIPQKVIGENDPEGNMTIKLEQGQFVSKIKFTSWQENELEEKRVFCAKKQ